MRTYLVHYTILQNALPLSIYCTPGAPFSLSCDKQMYPHIAQYIPFLKRHNCLSRQLRNI